MPVLTADAVVVGGGHHGLVAASAARRRRLGRLPAGGDRPASAARCGRQHCTPASPRTCSRRSTRCTPRRRSCGRWTWRRTGCAWSHAPAVLAHPPRPDGERAALLYRDREATAARLAEEHPRDGDAWLALCRQWDTVGDALLRTLFTTFPPVRGPVALLRAVGTADALRLRAGSCCCRPGGWARSCSRARARRLLLAGQRRARRRTRSTPRSAAPTAGCWPCSGSSTGSRCRSAGAGELAAALGRPRAGRRGGAALAASGWTGSTSAAAGPSPSTPRPG